MGTDETTKGDGSATPGNGAVKESAAAPAAASRLKRKRIWTFLAIVCVTTFITAFATFMLVDIFSHKQEEKNPYLRFVEVDENTTDPAPWGVNWPRQYEGYKRTAESTRTNFGGGDADPAQKSGEFPFLTRMFAGYAFSVDYRDRRGHMWMLFDQENTKRVTEWKGGQPGSCLHCHASVTPTYRRLGDGDVHAGFVKLSAMKYPDALAEVAKTGSENPTWNGTSQTMAHVDGAHPVSCVDCHSPKTMALRVTRPGLIAGLAALKANEGIKDYDVNRDATRQEMRTFVCAQCHVEYYCGPKATLFFPWAKGTKVEQIEQTYDDYKFPDGHRFYDWTHAETGAELLKAQHPEYELWSQGAHAKNGVSCSDCHMPYERQGAMKVSDHWVRSPMLNVARSCQQCHRSSEEDIKARVSDIQQKNLALLKQSGKALTDMLDAVKVVRAPFDQENRAAAESEAKAKLEKDAAYGSASAEEKAKYLGAASQAALDGKWAAKVATDPALTAIAELHRKGQWRLDFIAAENSMGFHAPQEAARILAESIDYLRQAQILAVEAAKTAKHATGP